MEQLLLHLVGDYLLQNDWMANEKTKKILPAFIHAFIYSLPFILITTPLAAAVIFISHFLIDHFRLVKYFLRLKEWRWKTEWGYITTKKESNYYGKEVKPAWMWVWLMIIADNTLHLIINYFSIKYISDSFILGLI